MKIIWVSDFSVRHNIGGAQRSDAIIIAEGQRLGYDITHFTYDSNSALLNDKYDHVISANLEAHMQINPSVFNFLISHPNHSRLEHDMNNYLTPFQRQQLFLSCQNTFFLTEYHHQLFCNTYGNFFQNVRIVQDPIDVNKFKDFNKNREDKYLYVGFMHELKGTFDFFTYAINHPEISFVVAGWGDKIFTHLAQTIPNVEYLGKIEHDRMPELYNRYKTFFYIPRIHEPFCRSAGEALLCGMELAVNNNIGCVHEYKRLGGVEFEKACGQAAATFWSYFNKTC